MNRFSAAVASTFLAAAISAEAQLNLLPSQIAFRTPATAFATTVHYGDFHAQGGDAGSNYGWIIGNRGVFYGDTYIQGNFSVTGSKNFVHPHPTDTSKAIRYVAIEAGEALTMARGTARTVGGAATVELPEDFALVTSDKAPLTVLLTVEGAPALAYVKSKSRRSLTVELKGSDLRDYGDLDFSYQITGVRDGFEAQKTIISIEDVANPVATELEKSSPAYKKRKDFGDRIQNAVAAAKAKGKK